MSALAHIMRKEILQTRRDPVMLRLLFVIPVIQLLVLGHAISGDVKHLRLAILDDDRTPASRALIQQMSATPYFDLIAPPATRRDAGILLDRGRATLVTVIPRHFARDLARGTPVRVQLLLDGQDARTASIALGYAVRMIADYGDGITADVVRPARVDARVWYNPNLTPSHYMVPGILTLLLTLVTTLLTSMGIVREREIGTLEQLLVTPIRTSELIVGKVLPFAAVGMILFTVSWAAAGALFHLPMRGSAALLLGVTAIYTVSGLGLGILVSTLTTTQQQSMFIVWFVTMLLIMLSGFFAPVENMPRILQVVSEANPLRHYLTCVREIMLKGAGVRELAREIGAIAACGGAFILLASARFQKRIG